MFPQKDAHLHSDITLKHPVSNSLILAFNRNAFT